jgi:SPX domain protein involved in polyphosphate accumulation
MIAQAESIQYRYERKFHVMELTRPQVESLVRLNPAMFSEIYHRRWVNNIYLDTWSMVSYHENLIGCSRSRAKYRIRWYGDLSGRVAQPILELKVKRGEVNRKDSFPLEPFVVDEHLSPRTLHDLFRAAALPTALRNDLLKLRPVLVNRYRRSYFLAADRRFRLTMDSDITYYDASDECQLLRFHWFDPASVVLELKYPVEAAQYADRISQHFPFRLTRNSKYMTGVEQVRCR